MLLWACSGWRQMAIAMLLRRLLWLRRIHVCNLGPQQESFRFGFVVWLFRFWHTSTHTMENHKGQRKHRWSQQGEREIHWQPVIWTHRWSTGTYSLQFLEAAAVTADGDPVARSTAPSGAEACYQPMKIPWYKRHAMYRDWCWWIGGGGLIWFNDVQCSQPLVGSFGV